MISTNWKIVDGLEIEGFPSNFVLPPVEGKGNDYHFIEKQYQQIITRGVDDLRVSIIICDGCRLLADLLSSLSQQNYPREQIEIIVAQDASNEVHPKPVPSHYKTHQPILEFSGEGPAGARNAAIKAASGEVVILLDRVDRVPYNFISTVMARQQAAKNALVFASQREDNIALIERTQGLRFCHFPFRSVDGACLAFPKELVERIGGFSQATEDIDSLYIEWAYRSHNDGYYLIPLPKKASPVGLPLAKPELDKPFLEDYCPLFYRTGSDKAHYPLPKVSIYIPAYNVGPYIQQAIESVLNQNYNGIEVCIVNDGSTDDTLDVLEGNYVNDPRVRWISQENRGIAAASNAAVRLCRGAYIGQLDGDDLLLPHAVRTLVDYLDRHDVGFVYGSNNKVDKEGKLLRPGYEWPKYSREKLMVSNIGHHFRMFRRRDWCRTPGFDESLEVAVDFDITLKFSEVCDIAHVPDVMYLYRWHGSNISITKRAEQRQSHLHAMRLGLARLGLDDTWEVLPPISDEVPDGMYQRKLKAHNLNYSQSVRSAKNLA